MKPKFKHYLILSGIFSLALIFRFWKISSLPGGLFPDEAANGLDVNSILSGHLQPFYERGNGREALFFYFIAAVVSLFGRGPWQHHVVSAGFGLAAVIGAYFLTRRLFNRPVAYLTAFFFGISSYAVTLSRTAFRANSLPLFAILTIFFIVAYFQSVGKKSRYLLAALGGASFALSFYTYISSRMLIPLLGIYLVLLLLAARDKLGTVIKEHTKPAVFYIIAFIIAFLPLGLYFFHHPDTIVGRAGQVSIFSQDLNNGDVVGTFLNVFKRTMLSFFTEGDLNWRHNVSGYPFLSPFISTFFGLGLLIFTFEFFRSVFYALRKQIVPGVYARGFVALWFWFMIVPEVTTAEGIPHGLRLVGVLPSIFIISAWTVYLLWLEFKKLFGGKTAKISAAIILSALFVYNFTLYFAVAANSPEYYYAFRSDLTTVSQYLNERDQKEKTYLSLDAFSVQTVEYLTTETHQPYILVVPEKTYEVSLRDGDQVVFTMSTLFDRIKFSQYHPDARLVRTEKNKFGEIIMLVYEK